MCQVDGGYLPREQGLLHWALWGEVPSQPELRQLPLVLIRNPAPPAFPQDADGAANTARTLATRGTGRTCISQDMVLP